MTRPAQLAPDPVFGKNVYNKLCECERGGTPETTGLRSFTMIRSKQDAHPRSILNALEVTAKCAAVRALDKYNQALGLAKRPDQ